MPEPIDLRIIKLGGEAPRITPENELAAPYHGGTVPDVGETEETEETEYPAAMALLAWEAPEFEYQPANAGILTKVGVLFIASGIAAAFFKNFLFAILLAIAGGLLFSYAGKTPRRLRFVLTSRGVLAGRHLYEFEDIRSFWIFYDPPLMRELALQSKRTFMPMVRVPLGDLDPVRLREVLLPFLKEERQEASVIDIISKRLGF